MQCHTLKVITIVVLNLGIFFVNVEWSNAQELEGRVISEVFPTIIGDQNDPLVQDLQKKYELYRAALKNGDVENFMRVTSASMFVNYHQIEKAELPERLRQQAKRTPDFRNFEFRDCLVKVNPNSYLENFSSPERDFLSVAEVTYRNEKDAKILSLRFSKESEGWKINSVYSGMESSDL